MYGFDPWRRTGLPAKFEQFRKNIELTKNQRDKIISSHIHLRQNNLRTLPYVDDAFLTGSYKRHTMIKPPNDVDLFVVINHSQYEITPNAAICQIPILIAGCVKINHVLFLTLPTVNLS